MLSVTVPDSIFARSRMSLISASSSAPDEWMVRANSTCFGVRLPPTLSASSRARISSELSGVRSSCDMFARNSRLVARGERELLRLLLQRRARLLDLAVLELDLVHLLGELARLLLQLLVRRAQLVLLGFQQRLGLLQVERLLLQAVVGLLQLLLLRLQLGGQRLRLVQQVFRLHVRRDGVQHHADRLGELVEEGLVDLAELARTRRARSPPSPGLRTAPAG